MKSLSGSLTWTASEKLLRPKAKFCFSSVCCRNWWAAVLSQLRGANPCCLITCFNFQWETKYQRACTLQSLFFHSLFPSSILLSKYDWIMWDLSFPFSLVLGILSHQATQGASSFPWSVELAPIFHDLFHSELNHKGCDTSMKSRQHSSVSAARHKTWTSSAMKWCLHFTWFSPHSSPCGPQLLHRSSSFWYTAFMSLREKSDLLWSPARVKIWVCIISMTICSSALWGDDKKSFVDLL